MLRRTRSPGQRAQAKGRYWLGSPPTQDDWGQPITSQFIDGKSRFGPWGIFTSQSWSEHGAAPITALGTGIGQLYSLQPDGKWLKTAG